MKVKIQPVLNPFSGETAGFVEVFDPRVVPARPAVAAVEAVAASEGVPAVKAVEAVPAYPGTITCIARFYDTQGGTMGQPIRNAKTELTDAQYSSWTTSVDDDEAYFTKCVMENLGLVAA